MGSKLYVGGLPYSATEQQLTEVFGAWDSGLCADYRRQVYGTVAGLWLRGNVLGC